MWGFVPQADLLSLPLKKVGKERCPVIVFIQSAMVVLSKIIQTCLPAGRLAPLGLRHELFFNPRTPSADLKQSMGFKKTKKRATVYRF